MVLGIKGLSQTENSSETNIRQVTGYCPDPEYLANRDVEEVLVLVKGDAIDLQIDSRTENFVPSIDLYDEPSGAIETSGPAKGMGEGRCRSKVGLNRLSLYTGL